jgi:hypothetical protein
MMQLEIRIRTGSGGAAKRNILRRRAAEERCAKGEPFFIL